MTSPETIRVTGPGNLHGTIDMTTWALDSCRAQVFVQLADGTSLLVPRDALISRRMAAIS